MRRSLRNVATLFSVLAIGTWFTFAGAADPKAEADAKKLQSDAMDVDFLSLDLKNAQKKLEDALKKCSGDKCSPAIVAGLRRDLGIVQINNKKVKDGEKSFKDAFAADPTVTIGKDFLSNAEVAKAWNAAKAAAPAATPTVTAPTTTATPTATTPTKPPAGTAEGNIEVANTLAPTGYPLPVVIELPEGLDADVVKLSYKTTAMEKYKTVEAKNDAGKYVVTIGCDDTQFVGEIKFYVRAYDADKNEVEHFGTLKKPAIIKLVDKLPDDVEAPAYPGGKEPEKCIEKGDCQPGFPCDKKGGGGKPQGSGCEADDECETGLSCVENENGKKWCYDTGDPTPGGSKPKEFKKLYFGLDIQQDMLFIGGENDICKQSTWACTKGGQDVGVNDSKGIDVAPGGGGRTSGGPALATTRIFAGLDYFINPNISLGGRVGYAFGGNPTDNAKFTPFHLEARVQYFFGPPKEKGARFYAMVGGGLAEFDAKVPNIVAVPFTPSKADDGAGCESAIAIANNDPSAENIAVRDRTCRVTGIDAYRLAGKSFIAPGGGVWIHLGKAIINVGAKILLPLPTFSPGLAFEAGVKF